MVSLIKAAVTAMLLALGVTSGTSEVPFEPYTCVAGEEFMSTLYNGVVDVPVVVQNDDYFNGVADKAGWEFTPAGVFSPSHNSVFIRSHHCDALSVEEGHEYHKRSRELVAHEAAHALDFAHDWTLSESIDWHETEIGHAAHVHAGHRELFAYCMMDVEFNDGRNRCPIENLAAIYKFMANFEIDGYCAPGRACSI